MEVAGREERKDKRKEGPQAGTADSGKQDTASRERTVSAGKEFQESAYAGQFTGIGIIMDLNDGQVIVISPIPGTPAARAGLLAGDRIVQIDGHPTRDMALQRAVTLIRGPSGTVVHLLVNRGSQAREVAITRGVIQDELVRMWSASGNTVFTVTHDGDEAILLSDRVALMTRGPS